MKEVQLFSYYGNIRILLDGDIECMIVCYVQQYPHVMSAYFLSCLNVLVHCLYACYTGNSRLMIVIYHKSAYGLTTSS